MIVRFFKSGLYKRKQTELDSCLCKRVYKNILRKLFIQFKEYKCKCLPGTGGTHCDKVVKRCTTNTCAQHGKCVDLPEHKYKCVCDVGYTGEFCEAKIDYCKAKPCKNEGFCQNANNDNKFTCKCPAGFVGDTCEVIRTLSFFYLLLLFLKFIYRGQLYSFMLSL